MTTTGTRTLLALSSYFKGNRFLRACHKAGWEVYLLTLEAKREEPWDHDAIEDVFAMPSFANVRHVINGLAYLMRAIKFDVLVALDDFDVELGAALRDHFRLGGLDLGTMRYFRDKLAMRGQAREAGIAVPAFTSIVHHPDVTAFVENVPPPWLLKPRMQASSIGIQKFDNADDLWKRIHELGDDQSDYLLEQFLPGTIYHVDTLTHRGDVVFAEVGQYHRPLLDVWTGGGVFGSRTVPRDVPEWSRLTGLTTQVLKAFRLPRGCSHTEWIRSDADGQFYFLETSARVGGAHISDMVEAATGLNLWEEWANIEMAGDGPYQVPELRREFGGVVVALCKDEHPDYAPFQDPEICLKVAHKHHIGLVVRCETPERVDELLDRYREIIARDYLAVMPPADRVGN